MSSKMKTLLSIILVVFSINGILAVNLVPWPYEKQISTMPMFNIGDGIKLRFVDQSAGYVTEVSEENGILKYKVKMRTSSNYFHDMFHEMECWEYELLSYTPDKRPPTPEPSPGPSDPR